MSILQISETAQTGEARWGVSLINDEGVVTLNASDPLPAAVASSSAKALVHKGPDAPTVEKAPTAHDRPAWFVDKADDRWLVRFTLVPETPFDLLLKPEDAQGGLKVIEIALERVKDALRKAEIKWDPPEADPAYDHKAEDLTPTIGHPGS